jgi:hypothetical protein
MQTTSNPYQRMQFILSLIGEDMIIRENNQVLLDSLLFGDLQGLRNYDPIFEKLLKDGVIVEKSWELLENEVFDPQFPMDTFIGYRFSIDPEIFDRYRKETDQSTAEYLRKNFLPNSDTGYIFSESTRDLVIDGQTLKINPGTLGFYICKHVFGVNPGATVDGAVILKDWDPAESKMRARSLYDGVYNLNKEINDVCKINKILTCRGGNVWITDRLSEDI